MVKVKIIIEGQEEFYALKKENDSEYVWTCMWSDGEWKDWQKSYFKTITAWFFAGKDKEELYIIGDDIED